MKKLILPLLLALPILGMSQSKNVVSANRVFVKPDKIEAFEKALANHAQKYHTGLWKWRVFEVQSGPDAGAYHITEGPTSWTDQDTRGTISKEHQSDWNQNIAPLTTERGTASYATYREDLSTIPLTEFTDKIAINHIYPKAGYFEKVEERLKNIKKAWEAGKQYVAVYEASVSGPPQFALVTRFKQGLKEREKGFRTPFKERYIAIFGAQAYDKYLEDIKTTTEKSWSEFLFYRPDLSSK